MKARLKSAAKLALRCVMVGGLVLLTEFATRGGLPFWLAACMSVSVFIAAAALDAWSHAEAYGKGIDNGREIEQRYRGRPARKAHVYRLRDGGES